MELWQFDFMGGVMVSMTIRFTGVRSPTTTGKIERFHGTLRTESSPARVPTLEGAKAAWTPWTPSWRPTS
jgi:transposase InsO family protein